MTLLFYRKQRISFTINVTGIITFEMDYDSMKDNLKNWAKIINRYHLINLNVFHDDLVDGIENILRISPPMADLRASLYIFRY